MRLLLKTCNTCFYVYVTMDLTLPMNSIMHLQRPIIQRLASISSSTVFFLRDVYIRYHELQCVYIYIRYFHTYFYINEWIIQDSSLFSIQRTVTHCAQTAKEVRRSGHHRRFWTYHKVEVRVSRGTRNVWGIQSCRGSWKMPPIFFGRNQTWCKCMVVLEGFPLNSVLFGLVI